MSVEELVLRYPEIPWYEPVIISHPTGIYYACRICIALHGLSGEDIPGDRCLGNTPDEWIEHMAVVHGA